MRGRDIWTYPSGDRKWGDALWLGRLYLNKGLDMQGKSAKMNLRAHCCRGAGRLEGQKGGPCTEGWWPGHSPQAEPRGPGEFQSQVVLRQVSSWSGSSICDFTTLFGSMGTDRGGGEGS